MDCEKYLERMSAALDGECSAEERRELDSHLAACPRCADLFKALSDQSAALRELDCEPPAGLTQRIMANLPEQKKPGKVIHWKRWGSLAACLILVAAVGILVPRSMRAGSAAPMSAYPSAALVAEEPSADLRFGNSSTSFGGLKDGSDAVEAKEPGAAPEASGYELAPNAAQEPDFCFFDNQQTIRVSYGATPAAPSARIIGSTEELAGYLAQFGPLAYNGEGNPLPMEELDALAGTYTEEFFETGRLLCVVVEASSGSTRYELDPQGLTRESVTVRVTVPEEGTCDMAAWLLVAEVGDQFQSGDTLEVLFIP